MGFTDFVSDAGLTLLNTWLASRSYIIGHAPTQADVKVFEAFKEKPAVEKYPHAARWYKHIATYESEFTSLPGDPSKAATAYGPEVSTLPIQPKAPADDAAAAEDDDEVDLFGSESEEDEEKQAETARRLEEYKKKKEGKTKPAAKSIVTMEVKPWDDETDLKAMEAAVRAIEQDGLVWGGSKLQPVGFGIFKLQINLVVEDEKVSLEDLQESISELEDYVQSTDVIAMQKL
ncbi:hypothetical protein EJ05DRAFT_491362 [Pseudovirgaria hyperparasitica]|uniref:Elongation factor 1-beta n=1 Tax=Pseudovirgaria hyperparasitica TaxID=470096 RepID=A0A6A6WFJ1_9PEZI|nr:uncharacterized protein EJ05DRAFT_491362 [Pseudovirgaria hyperparasitica]KAF2761503.1 hypothetical protein EJ05DRAFT_491362 [Pseudovirgaria hyperparasitica]